MVCPPVARSVARRGLAGVRLRAVNSAARHTVRTLSTSPGAPRRVVISRSTLPHHHFPFSHSYTTQAPSYPAPTKLSVVAPAATYAGVDAVVVPVAQSANKDDSSLTLHGLDASRAASTAAQLSKLGYKAKADGIVSLPGADGDLTIYAGLGKPAADGSINPETLRRAVGAALRAANGMELATVAVVLPAGASAELVTAAAEGASLGAYTWSAYKSKDATAPVASIQIATDAKDAAETVRRAEVAARHTKLARDLHNMPPNDLYPQTFAQRAVEEGAKLAGVEVTVWDEVKLKEEGCGGLVAVGKGSIRPPRLVKIAYTPKGVENPKHLAIVGKGVTFDSGGISLKPSAKMFEMKGDMGGAAATLHAVLAAAELEVPARVTGWLCLAENMPSGAALKNGDVIVHRTGTTVECHNTDAEGRLVLADGLACAQAKDTGYGTEETDPDLLLNVATLTGAQLVAFGMRTAAVMGDDKAVAAVQAGAAASGEAFWPMPLLVEEMLPDLKSTTADLKNIGGIAYGGMIKAGVFLSQFAGDKGNWAHLDIAGPAANFGAAYGYTPTEGTGFAVRTLLKVAEQM